MRTAIGIVLIQYMVLIVLPGELRASTILVPVVSVTGLAVVVFVLPLWGMHRRLVEAKKGIEGDINTLLKEIGGRVDPVRVDRCRGRPGAAGEDVEPRCVLARQPSPACRPGHGSPALFAVWQPLSCCRSFCFSCRSCVARLAGF